ncbi:hypothetical protein [Amphritea pacifica]|uniref:KilA-N domain-containing protein n=1 Tax=Amphritea pacifica TaxID=2811233 RepID=A0ABS2WD16_9GAMM|nr:hypothetical protein [Amphritea pacifica]MBN0989520.1 hypothetical protein [Amphritea pacifica]
MKSKLQVLDQSISTTTREGVEYICITDIAKYKGSDCAAHIIGIWEKPNNPDFKVLEFEDFKKEVGIPNVSLFGVRAKQWRDENPTEKGNMRDHANIHQLVCLANLESMNAHYIQQEVSQSERIVKLNQLAIQQMSVLLKSDTQLLHNDE